LGDDTKCVVCSTKSEDLPEYLRKAMLHTEILSTMWSPRAFVDLIEMLFGEEFAEGCGSCKTSLSELLSAFAINTASRLGFSGPQWLGLMEILLIGVSRQSGISKADMLAHLAEVSVESADAETVH
jgi:hypothetical protein